MGQEAPSGAHRLKRPQCAPTRLHSRTPCSNAEHARSARLVYGYWLFCEQPGGHISDKQMLRWTSSSIVQNPRTLTPSDTPGLE